MIVHARSPQAIDRARREARVAARERAYAAVLQAGHNPTDPAFDAATAAWAARIAAILQEPA